MSRPTLFTEELAQSLCNGIAHGLPLAIACQVAEIDYSTLKRWKKNNALFCAAIKKARAQALAVRLQRIEKAARGGEEIQRTTRTITRKDGTVEETVTIRHSAPVWQADAWYLERQFCEEFGLNRIELKEVKRRIQALIQQMKQGSS